MLSERINRIQPSPTLAISARSKAMRAAGEDVISFDVGEPDFDTPQHIKDACITALRNGDTKYTAAAGHARPARSDLPQAQARKRVGIHARTNRGFLRRQAFALQHFSVDFQCGRRSDYSRALLGFVSRPSSAGRWRAGFHCRLRKKRASKLRAQQLDDCLKAHPRAKAFVLNSPSNPSGAVYSPEHLRELCAVLENYPNVLVITDEIYEHMVYAPNTQWSVAKYSEEFAQRTVIVQGCAKSYAMTGWRIGWTVSTLEMAKAMGKLQSQSTSNATSFAQAGAIAALDGGVDQAMMAEFEKRGKVMRELLNDVPGFDCIRPEGAFYCFPKVSGLFGVMVGKDEQISTATDLSEYLLRVAKVACVPGEGFGAPDHVRFSYANSMENIKEGINRVLRVLPE